MSYDAQSTIYGSDSRMTAPIIQAWFEAHARQGAQEVGLPLFPIDAGVGANIMQYATYTGINAAIAAGLIAHESAYLQSLIYRTKFDPSGLGAENDNPLGKAITFVNANEGIRATFAHLVTYAKADADPMNALDPRYDNIVANGWHGSVHVLADLEQRWAWSPEDDYAATPPEKRYGAMVAAQANSLAAFAEAHAMVDISGFVPPRITQQPFPANGISYLGKDMVMHGVCIHETGNTDAGSEAQGNVTYLNSAECINRQASWHATVGLDTIIETISDKKQAYHASDGDGGEGNMHFYAIEGVMCYPVGTPEFQRVMLNHAWYAAKKLHDNNLPLAFNAHDTAYDGSSSVAQHNTFARDHKDCPQFYRDAGLWDQFCACLSAFYAAKDQLFDPLKMPDLDAQLHDGFYVPICFLNFYNAHGGVEVFGLFTTGVFLEKGKLVQYTEASRLEYAPTLPWQVQRGLVANELRAALA